MTFAKMLVKDRNCGSCSVCCTSLRIDEPTLTKKADVPCINLKPQGGCSIYEDRPPLCKRWYCGWRMLPLEPSMRPDRCNVIIIHGKADYADFEYFTFSPASKNEASALLTQEVLQSICALISRNIKVAISVPTQEGYCSYRDIINDAMHEAVESRSKIKVYEAMVSLISIFSQQKTDPVKPLNIIRGNLR